MICPECDKKLKIIDSRPFGKNVRIRKYECQYCGFEDVTEERLTAKNQQKQTKIYI
jgi:transcriptional regulator NrdR family protein